MLARLGKLGHKRGEAGRLPRSRLEHNRQHVKERGHEYPLHTGILRAVQEVSRKLVTLVYERRIGSMLRKAVLACMADRANDNGSGIWMSKGRIADEIEASRRAVITCIQGLVADGLLFDHGRRHRSTYEYAINVSALIALPRSYLGGVQNFTPDPKASVQIFTPPVNDVHTKCEPGSHEPIINQELSYVAERERRAAEAQALSAMNAQGLASQRGQEAVAALEDMQARGKVSLKDIREFKAAIRGERDGELFVCPSYEPPEYVAAILTAMCIPIQPIPKLQSIAGGKS